MKFKDIAVDESSSAKFDTGHCPFKVTTGPIQFCTIQIVRSQDPILIGLYAIKLILKCSSGNNINNLELINVVTLD